MVIKNNRGAGWVLPMLRRESRIRLLECSTILDEPWKFAQLSLESVRGLHSAVMGEDFPDHVADTCKSLSRRLEEEA